MATIYYPLRSLSTHHALRVNSLVGFILLLLSFPTHAQKTCYMMNGSPHSQMRPCRPEATHSPCCLLAATDPSKNDLCFSSGLCYSPNSQFYISGCTDPTWESEACPHICPDKASNWQGDANGDWRQGKEIAFWEVPVCNAGRACCRTPLSPDTCCEGDMVKSLVMGTPVYPSSTVIATSLVPTMGTGTTMTGGSTAPTTGETTVPTTGCYAVGEGDGVPGNRTGEADCSGKEKTIGAAVGASLGAALVGMMGALWFLVRRQKKLVGALESYEAAASVQAPPYVSGDRTKPMVELGSGQVKYELATNGS